MHSSCCATSIFWLFFLVCQFSHPFVLSFFLNNSNNQICITTSCKSRPVTTRTSSTTTNTTTSNFVLKMAPNIKRNIDLVVEDNDNRIRCALLGCGMMGQEHISYIMGYSNDIRIDYLCDPCPNSLETAQKVMKSFQSASKLDDPMILEAETELLTYADQIDLLVIASPNYLHTPTLLKWGYHDLTILVEKPVAVSQEQHDELREASQSDNWKARLWVAMEYRYIPAIAKLISMLPQIGELKMITIRENRYPFLHKVGEWNRDKAKTGDTLVEKCCHFFDLFRLITGQEASLSKVRALAQRGINYGNEPQLYDVPIIDSAYVTMPFVHRKDDTANVSDGDDNNDDVARKMSSRCIGNLELCMFAEGSRHQEEIIATGTKGRLEAYLPENKVYFFERPSFEQWKDRSVPPPPSSIRQHVYDCSDVKGVFGIKNDQQIPTHGGYHYSSTAVEWYYLLNEIKNQRTGGQFCPQVSLNDGLRAVEIGIQATSAIVNNDIGN